MNRLRTLTDSLGRPVAATDEGMENFARWYGQSQVRDAEGRPLVVLHGTRGDFSVFDRSKGGTNTPNKPQDVAFHFTDQPLVADRYADLSGVVGQNVMPSYLSISRPKVFDKSTNIGADDIDEAIAEGYDGLIIRHGGRVGNEYVAFRPEQIKSATGNSGAYSRTNPDITGSATPAALAATAAAAGTGAAAYTAAQGEEGQPNRLRDLLATVGESARRRWEREVESLKGIGRAIADVAPDVYNGLSRLPYRVAGAPVDIADTVVRPIAAFAGQDYGNPVGGSEWMIQQAQEAGLLPPSSGSIPETAGDFLGALADPSPIGEANILRRMAIRPTMNRMADLPYAGSHRPMTIEQGGAPAFDLTPAFGDDIYGPNAMQYFGAGVPGERETLRVLRQIRGNPDAMVTIYRGVPDEVSAINPGDWVSLSPQYAAEYGKVLSQKVPARDLVGSGDAFFEFGYYPSK